MHRLDPVHFSLHRTSSLGPIVFTLLAGLLTACGNGDGGEVTPPRECGSGFYLNDAHGGEVCVAYRDCGPGEYVSAAGSATSDRACLACGAGKYSAQDNADACTPFTECAPGEHVSAAGSATSDRACLACGAGEYSAQDNADACAPFTECAPGQYVSAAGSATSDRACLACGAGEYSAQDNADACAPFTECAPDTREDMPGTSASDRTCVDPRWTRQFGSTASDYAYAVSADGQGSVYVAGYTYGALTGDENAGRWDAFLRKYDSAGEEVWTRQFGSAANDYAQAVSADGQGNVYVAGYTNGALTADGNAGGSDAFLRKYDSAGEEQWTRQFGSVGGDSAQAVSADGQGNVYVAGYTDGALPEQESKGGSDAFLRKYDSAGVELWTRQFGSAKSDSGNAVSADGQGNVYVAGTTQGALTADDNAGARDVFLRQYDSAGDEQWTRQFGSAKDDYGRAVSADAEGNVYVAGDTEGALTEEKSAGDYDAFLRKYDSAGEEQWTRQFGSEKADRAYGVSADGKGNVYIAGDTQGALTEDDNAGGSDAFLRHYDSAGEERWTRQFGSTEGDYAQGVGADGQGNVYVAGITQGALPDQEWAGGYDVFVALVVAP